MENLDNRTNFKLIELLLKFINKVMKYLTYVSYPSISPPFEQPYINEHI